MARAPLSRILLFTPPFGLFPQLQLVIPVLLVVIVTIVLALVAIVTPLLEGGTLLVALYRVDRFPALGKSLDSLLRASFLPPIFHL